MSKAREGFLRVILTMVVALAIGALLIIGIGENPISAYGALLQGAFDGKFRLGTTLAGFTPLLLTSTAFAIAAKAGAFNVGVEGEVFLGGIVAAYIGINWTFLPKRSTRRPKRRSKKNFPKSSPGTTSATCAWAWRRFPWRSASRRSFSAALSLY